jgi:hypothetical protein
MKQLGTLSQSSYIPNLLQEKMEDAMMRLVKFLFDYNILACFLCVWVNYVVMIDIALSYSYYTKYCNLPFCREIPVYYI